MRTQIAKLAFFVTLIFVLSGAAQAGPLSKEEKDVRKQAQREALQKRFQWWPTDAKPGAVQDPERGGYWWMPKTPGSQKMWGNRGYIYVYKIIFDYKQDQLPPPKQHESRPSLLIRKIDKNIKVYFDYNKAELRPDASSLLEQALTSMKKHPDMSILITGNADVRGTEQYNLKLAEQRADSVKKFMLSRDIPESRIRIISRGKLDAIAPVTDLVGMQKDRNAQFMVADVQEVMIPYEGGEGETLPANAIQVDEKTYKVEQTKTIESDVKVSTKTYVVKEGDTLSKIAGKELGSPYRWEYLYEINKDKIRNPNKLRPGQTIVIPVE